MLISSYFSDQVDSIKLLEQIFHHINNSHFKEISCSYGHLSVISTNITPFIECIIPLKSPVITGSHGHNCGGLNPVQKKNQENSLSWWNFDPPQAIQPSWNMTHRPIMHPNPNIDRWWFHENGCVYIYIYNIYIYTIYICNMYLICI